MSDIDHVMLRTGRIVAADQNLEVEVRGSAAYAVPGRVVIPSVECYEHLGEHAVRMLHGLLDHECGHASDTDFDVFARGAAISPAFKHLLNSIEDGYIEGRKGTQWRGIAQNLAKKNTWFWEVAAAGSQTVPERIRTGELWESFLLALTCVVRPFGGKRVADIEPLRPDVHAMLMLCEDEIAEVATLYDTPKATARTYALAETIYERFQRLAEEAKPRPDDHGKGEGSESPGEPGEGEPGEGEGAPGEGPGEPGDGDPDDGSDKEGDEDGDTLPSPFARLDLQRWSPPPGRPLNPEQAVQAEVNSVFEQPRSVAPYIVFDPSFDAHRNYAIEEHDADVSAVYEKFEVEARTATDALTMAFEAGLRAKRERRPVFGADEGFVDPVVLPEFATGAVQPDRMYLQYAAEDDARGVAATVLVDCSGSMGNGKNSKSYLARIAAIAMHQALRAVQVPHEVSGFTTLTEAHVGEHYFTRGNEAFAAGLRTRFKQLRAALIEAEKHGTDVTQFARVCRAYGYGGGVANDATLLVPIHATFKSFDQQDGRGLSHITGNQENLDGEALLWQARRLAQRPERRRVMIVMSDGLPAGSRDNAQGARYLGEAVERIIEAGIEVYGIGIKSDAVQKFYPIWWRVNDVEDLARVAVEAMTDVIVHNRNEQEWVAPL